MAVVGQSRFLLIGVSAGIGLVAIGVTVWLRSRNREQLPTKWKKIGELGNLMCFPIKSCGPIRENEMECTTLGLQKGLLRDRTFMIVDLKGTFLTGRQHPKMVLIQPQFKDKTLKLNAPNMTEVIIDLDVLAKQQAREAIVWGDPVPAIDSGEEVAHWLSKYLLSADSGLRLAYYPQTIGRYTKTSNIQSFPKIKNEIDTGALTDFTSYNLMAESSVVDLNTRIDKIVPVQQFRPNFVVKGSKAYDEDNWDYIKIGSDAVFRSIRPCSRCLMTTINPDTGVKDSNTEPLTTLRSYRQHPDEKIRQVVHNSPILGIQLGLRLAGVIKLGDPIYINVKEM